jgi:hypothetical protein
MKLHRLLPLLLLAACAGDPSGIGDGDVRMTISVSGAVPPPQNNVTVQVRNEGDRTLYVANRCGTIIATGIERRSGGGWVGAPYGYICLAYTPPIALAPGETLTSAIDIDEPGIYRGTVRIGTTADEDEFSPVRREFTIGE